MSSFCPRFQAGTVFCYNVSMPARISDLDTVFETAITSLLTLAGAAVLVMLVVGGFHYLHAGQDKEAASKAWATVTYAVLGLATAASAFMILTILGNFLGVNLGNFTICAVTGC